MFRDIAVHLHAHNFSPGVQTHQDPEDVVLSGIKDQALQYGITIGKPPRTFIPDVLLGFLDLSGRWVWPHSDRPGVAHNLNASIPDMPLSHAYPVWLTVTSVQHQQRLQRRKKHIDICGYIQHHLRQRFWIAALEEFTQRTWHPSRLLSWCLDTEESADFCT